MKIPAWAIEKPMTVVDAAGKKTEAMKVKSNWTEVVPGVGEHGAIDGCYWWKYYPLEASRMTFMDRFAIVVGTTALALVIAAFLLGAAVLITFGGK